MICKLGTFFTDQTKDGSVSWKFDSNETSLNISTIELEVRSDNKKGKVIWTLADEARNILKNIEPCKKS